MKKAFDQTVRDIKRGVNKKVLKVPGIEQKVLDATSNEPWGPHGSLLADIADASRNYHEYQMIMAVILKRISDTGKNWRHVYKGLTVLEYLVAHGSERVIEEIRERAYQISTLSRFQYIDSSGRDQGNNVRRKSQSLVALVNDKERIIEVREKAAANKDKFRSSAAGGMYRPSSFSGSGYGDKYDYDRYGGRDDDRRSYSRDGDRYSRYSEERNGRDDDYRARSRSVDNYQYGSRSRSSDRGIDDDARSSSRGSGARVEDTQDGRRPLERKFSEQNIGAPPSYEEVVSESRSPVQNERDGEVSAVSAPEASSPATEYASKGTDKLAGESSPAHQNVEAFNDFDPRGHPTSIPASVTSTASVTAFPATSSNVENDLLGYLSDSFSSNPLAIVPVDYPSGEPNSNANSASAPYSSAAQPSTQPFDDPFGDTPFKAISSSDSNQIPPSSASPSLPRTATGTDVPSAHAPSQAWPQKESSTSQNETDILAGILPLSGPSVSLHAQTAAPDSNMDWNFHPQPAPNLAAQTTFGQATHSGGYFHPQQGFAVPMTSHMPPSGPAAQHSGVQGGLFLPVGSSAYVGSHPTNTGLTGVLALVPHQPSKEKFEPKSAIWADTLNRGLVDLNISGHKTNPLADIGVDFDAINRKDKRLVKPTSTPLTSTVTMGKAMGSGSGFGRAGTASLRPPLNPVMGGGYGGMNQSMGMNMSGMNLGMAQSGYPRQQHQGMASGSAMRGGYNPMMGSGGNNPQRPYYGGYQ